MEENDLRQCKNCLEVLSLENFYSKQGKKDKSLRWDNICKECKKKRKREKYKPSSSPAGSVEICNELKAFVIEPSRDKEKKVFKRYYYPDGRVLELTKEEFKSVVRAMRMLINAKREREGRPLLLE